jgi:hypothetical protein
MPTPLWSHQLADPIAGLAFARESGHVLTWDVSRHVVLLSGRGTLQSQFTDSRPCLSADIADVGSAIAIANDESIAWLRPDLTPRWRKPLGARPTAIAIDSHGRCVAVADAGNKLHLFDKSGRPIGSLLATPRPLYHLHFLATEPLLIGAADFGLLTALDLRTMRWTWQDNPVIHLGDLTGSADGQTIAVSCFSEGVRRYDPLSKSMAILPTPEPCRYVGMSNGGRHFLVGTIVSSLIALDDSGRVCFDQRFDQPVAGVALSPLADTGIVALADGRVLGLDLRNDLK